MPMIPLFALNPQGGGPPKLPAFTVLRHPQLCGLNSFPLRVHVPQELGFLRVPFKGYVWFRVM